MKTLTESLLNSLKWKKYGFIVIKPGFLHISKQIIEIFENEGWEIEQIKTKKLLPIEACELYKIHKKEDFYKELCDYMSSDLSTGILLKKYTDKQYNEFEEIKNIKDKIRDEFGESDMRNVLHSSDSIENLPEEAKYYFQLICL